MDLSARLVPPLVATHMQAALSHRSWTISGTAAPPLCHIFLVSQGEATFSGTGLPHIPLSGPCLLWLPRDRPGVFRLTAGSEGMTCTIAEDFARRVAGDSQVASQLAALVPNLIILSSTELAPILAELSVSFAVLLRETRDQQPGATAAVAAHVSLIFLHVWRASGLQAVAGRGSAAGTTVGRFRQLVELHYREDWDVEAYARTLGVTRAHLHDACLRDSGRTPLALIHGRIIAEAKLRLEQTALLVEQVGYSLGFREPAYFNRFFKRVTGQSPGAYRRARRAARLTIAEASFAAWP